jgi:hypothetical protein
MLKDQFARQANAVKHFRSRIRQNLDLFVRVPKSGDFGYGQNTVNSSRKNASQRCRQALLDNFDEEVHARLKFHRKEAFASLSQRKIRGWLQAIAEAVGMD